MTKVPRACKKLPQLTKRCMNGKGQSSKNCKKLPTITKKCQRLSESWQLLAETLKNVAKKGAETVAPKEEDSHMTLPPDEEWSYDEGSYEYDEYYGSNGSSEDGEAASESTKNENERKGTIDKLTLTLIKTPTHTHPWAAHGYKIHSNSNKFALLWGEAQLCLPLCLLIEKNSL